MYHIPKVYQEILTNMKPKILVSRKISDLADILKKRLYGMPNRDDNRVSIGVFGCGSIGRELAYQISQTSDSFANINALCDRSISKAQTLNEDLQLNSLIANDLERITEQHDVDVIVECASISAVWDKATMILENG